MEGGSGLAGGDHFGSSLVPAISVACKCRMAGENARGHQVPFGETLAVLETAPGPYGGVLVETG